MAKKLTLKNVDTFFDNVEKGEIFTYSNQFNLQHVRSSAIRKGWMLEYCAPKTKEYNIHGTNTCVVVQKLSWRDAYEISELMNYLP